jgi:hypothetical protein
MFNSAPNLQFSRYLINPDECYASNSNFEQTLKLMEFLSANTGAGEPLSLTDDVLIIETNEGVFVRAQDPQWCALLTSLTEHPDNKIVALRVISQSDWFNVTTKYRAPLQSLGNDKLARWRVGF